MLEESDDSVSVANETLNSSTAGLGNPPASNLVCKLSLKEFPVSEADSARNSSGCALNPRAAATTIENEHLQISATGLLTEGVADSSTAGYISLLFYRTGPCRGSLEGVCQFVDTSLHDFRLLLLRRVKIKDEERLDIYFYQILKTKLSATKQTRGSTPACHCRFHFHSHRCSS